MVFKINPKLPNVGRSFNGKTVQSYTIDFAVNGTDFSVTEMGPNGAFQRVLSVLSKLAVITMYSALRTDGSNAGQVFDVFLEGEFPTDTYDGTDADTFAAFLQTELRAFTDIGLRTAAQIAVTGETANVAGLDLSTATVVPGASGVFYADQVNV